MTGSPEMDEILERAKQHRRDVSLATGSPPEWFMVTEREYALLELFYGGPVPDGVNDEMQIIGMKVCRQARLPWYRDNRYMEHFKMPAISQRAMMDLDRLPAVPIRLEYCRTELPSRVPREILCPCGEVIWDMSTCRWAPPRMPHGVVSSYTWSSLESDAVSRGQDPLPPIDDLDEGRTCCGRTYPTFAEFMAHLRRHGEG